VVSELMEVVQLLSLLKSEASSLVGAPSLMSWHSYLCYEPAC
jgi:hypothetical protein